MDRPMFYSIKKFKDPLGFHRVKVYNNPEILKYILDLRLKARDSKRKEDSIYLVCAPEGGGKSNLTLLMYDIYCELTGEIPDITNITRNLDELMNRYAVLGRKSFVTLDEAQELGSDRWNEKKSKEIKEKFTIMRERGFISALCHPNPLKFNTYFREDRVRGIFFIIRPGLVYYYANSMDCDHFTQIVDTWDKFNKTRSLKALKRYAPDYIMYYPEYTGMIREAYDKRKDENITFVLDKGKETNKRPENYLSPGDCSKIMDVTPATISRYIKKGLLKTISYGIKSYILKEDLELLISSKIKGSNSNDADQV